MNSSSNRPRARSNINNFNKINKKIKNINRRINQNQRNIRNNRIRSNNNNNIRNNNNNLYINKRNRTQFRRNQLNNQNVIKVNRPKNIIQRNFNQNNKNSIIKGKDLIIPTNNQLVNQQSGVYAIIPINPLYWQGTRIKNMALQYQYFIPKNLSIEYVPTVSKFQQGTITIGCITKQIINQNTIQQTLVSSTSGETFSCSEYFNKNIALTSLLQQKKLLLSSDITKESVPFYIVVLLNGVLSEDSLIAPGSIYFNYNIHFFNPITETLIYETENSIKLRDIQFNQQNITCLLLEENNNYGIGTQIDVELKNQQPVFKYNNTEIQLDLEKYATVFYSSSPNSLKQTIKFDLTDFSYASSDRSVTLSGTDSLLIIDEDDYNFAAYIKISSTSITITQGQYYKILDQNPDQIIQYLQDATIVLTQFNVTTSAIIKGNFIQVVFINQHN